MAIDALLIACAMALAFWLRFEGNLPAQMMPVLWRAIALAVGIKILVLYVFRVYRVSWRHVGLGDLMTVGAACVVGTSMLAAVLLVLQSVPSWLGVPRSILGIDLAFCFLALGGVRMSRRILVLSVKRTRLRGVRALLVGAGDAGAELLRTMESDPTYVVLGVLDDDPAKAGFRIRGIPVLGRLDEMQQRVQQNQIASVLIAMPSSSPGALRSAVEQARKAGVSDIKIIPPLSELYSGRVTIKELRTVRPEDLLRRDSIRIDTSTVERYLEGQTVLVTGAAGSIGSELCRQSLRLGASRLIALDFNETGLFYLDNELQRLLGDREFEVKLADVRDLAEMRRIMCKISPHVVYHAAAYKHVPMMEAFPAEAVKTNVFGSQNVLAAACEAGCDAFVMISTDKAVNPTSVMGTTKRVAEMIVRLRANIAGTRCAAVRFGNVLGSRGSVLRTFQEQVEERRSVTVTHPDMKRYFMVTSEAVQLVLQAGVIGKNGQVLVLDMGEPVQIVDLAGDVIRFYGLEPDVDVPIVYTGLRPGEKLFEELLTAEEGSDATTNERVFVARLAEPDPAWSDQLDELRDAANAADGTEVRRLLGELVPSYEPSGEES